MKEIPRKVRIFPCPGISGRNSKLAPLVSNNQRATFKRETLLKSVSLVVAKLAQLDLPATITAILILPNFIAMLLTI